MQRLPVVGVEAGGPGLGAPTAAQEHARKTRDVLDRLLATCSSHRLADICDRAVALALSDPTSPTLRCLAIQRGRPPMPVSQMRRGGCLLVDALGKWLVRGGPVHRAIDRRKAVEESALAPQSINLIVKRRCALVGLDATVFAAHGLRSAYLTEAARRSIPLPWTMQQRQQRGAAGAWLQK